MKQTTKAQMLRVYMGEQDHSHGGLLYPAVVARLRELGVAGVTVLHGVEGYGAHGKLHTARFENLFTDLPIVVEAVDIPERIALAAAALDELIAEGLVTISDVTAIRYTKDPHQDAWPPTPNTPAPTRPDPGGGD